MAKLVGNKRCFYSLDTSEAYQTEDGTIARLTRSDLKCLGDKIDIYRDTDIEGLRVKRAISLIEKSGGQLLKRTRDKSSRRRLEIIMRKVLGCYEENYQVGMRSIHNGLLTTVGRDMLKGFDFNPHSAPGAVLGDEYHIDLQKNVLVLSGFSPRLLLAKTPHDSQLRVCFLLSQVDFLLGEFITFMSDELTFTATDPDQELRLKIGKIPQFGDVHIAYLWIGFERDDAVAIPELLWRVDDVFRVMDVQGSRVNV